MLYLIHLDRPFGHAKHYLGFAEDAQSFERRIWHHRRGSGANLLKHVNAAGIDWSVVRTWPEGDRTTERRLKGHSSTRMCPVCNPEGAHRHGVRQSRRSAEILS